MTTKNDVENRVFLLNRNVTEDSLEGIILGILEINRQDENKINKTPIKLIIDSNGGSCYSGMALVNVIRTSKTPVHTYCYSKAFSMALTIFACGHKRFAHKDAFLMQHQQSVGTQGTMTDIIQDTEQMKRLQDIMDNVLIENSNIRRSTLLEYREKKIDWFFTGEEGYKLGVVDELL